MKSGLHFLGGFSLCRPEIAYPAASSRIGRANIRLGRQRQRLAVPTLICSLALVHKLPVTQTGRMQPASLSSF